MILLVGINIVNFWRKLRDFFKRSIRRAKEDAITTRRAIFQLGNTTDRSHLKYAESHFKLLILEAQDKTKSVSIFLATIAFILLILYAWGMSVQVLKNQSPQSLVFELLGTLGVLIIVFWNLEVNLRSQILTYKRCLFVLSQAQLISASLSKETANEPLAIKHKGQVIGYYYPKGIRKPEQRERDHKRLEKALNRVLAETEVSHEELAPLPNLKKALPDKDAN